MINQTEFVRDVVSLLSDIVCSPSVDLLDYEWFAVDASLVSLDILTHEVILTCQHATWIGHKVIDDENPADQPLNRSYQAV